ncbi:hypothetical protein WICMUC_004948 [Wickerhamomyces mucosus]|uniref:Uncharacterized protein n=1 Tax=Wickerhamomyces mucosus TaxID=1378264 RepID=A0A9P8T853_9ASCO|nr:hypothetical protein WICMUC_004948 [Wickerhamomyces mucosus]
MSSAPITISEIIQTLTEYTPCDVSDALQKVHSLKDGGNFPNLTRYSESFPSKTTVGPAYTVLFAPLDDPRPKVPQHYIDVVPENSVVVIALTKDLQVNYAPYTTVNNALYGGLMSTRAQYLGAKGSIIFGRIRDLEEHRGLKYPVYAYGTATAAANGSVVKCIGINVPLEINVGTTGVYEQINPNDLIIADENGVVRIPTKSVNLQKIIEYIPKRVDADQNTARDIAEGVAVATAQKKYRAGL